MDSDSRTDVVPDPFARDYYSNGYLGGLSLYRSDGYSKSTLRTATTSSIYRGHLPGKSTTEGKERKGTLVIYVYRRVRFFLRFYRIETNRAENSGPILLPSRVMRSGKWDHSYFSREANNRESLLHAATRYSRLNERNA